MMLFPQAAVCVCLAVALGLCSAAPSNLDVMQADQHDGGHKHTHEGHHHDVGHGGAQVQGHVHRHDDHDHVARIDRCEGIEFDAIAPDAQGNTYFFKGDHMWKGFNGPSEWINGSYKELEEHHAHLGHIDAAVCLHHNEDKEHKHVYFFLNDKVFSYHDHTLEEGFPKDISVAFPGIPNHVDAAVECPKGECVRDSVIFFKGCHVFHFDTHTKKVKSNHWAHLSNCTSAMRWQNHYYCFHGHQFTKFHPITGSVTGVYPKDARDYFMKCPNFGRVSNHTERERCSHVTLDAIAWTGPERAVAFRGDYLLRENGADGWHATPIAESFKEVKSDVHAAFFDANLFYIIKEDQVFAYKDGSTEPYDLVEGYPKALTEELGVQGPVDAAFVCGEHSVLSVVKGNQMFQIDLSTTPRAVVKEARLPFGKVDAAMCRSSSGPDTCVCQVFVGAEYFEYETPMLLAYSRIRPEPHKVSLEMFGCDH